jgi:3-hydroxyacyl-[acyl-carrier-protein] dehydratase
MTRIEFDVLVPADHPALPGHFPGRPIVPGVLLLDRVIAALQQHTGQRVAGLRRVKFTAALLPAEVARTQCDLEADGAGFRVSVQRGEQRLQIAVGHLVFGGPDGRSR